jgi:hypothetical protein
MRPLRQGGASARKKPWIPEERIHRRQDKITIRAQLDRTFTGDRSTKRYGLSGPKFRIIPPERSIDRRP